MLLPEDLIAWDKELSIEDKDLVGIELASLGEISKKDVEILPHIIFTTYALEFFLEKNNLKEKIKHLLGSINHDRHDSITQTSQNIRSLILHSEIPQEITKVFHKRIDRLNDLKFGAISYHFFKNKSFKEEKISSLHGDSVILENVRELWANLFSLENLTKFDLHHENHNYFSSVIAIYPEFEYSLTGHIKVIGLHEYEIEAHKMVKFTYSKNSSKIEKAIVIPGGLKEALKPDEVKTLLDYAKIIDKTFYHHQTAFWGKAHNKFLVTKIIYSSDFIEPGDSFNSLIKTITVHPGVTVGRLRVINEENHATLVLEDEIVVVKKLDKKMIDSIKKAKGIILEDEIHPEVSESLKKLGIPTVIKKGKPLLYSTGDVISLNATTGEVKRGNLLVS